MLRLDRAVSLTDFNLAVEAGNFFYPAGVYASPLLISFLCVFAVYGWKRLRQPAGKSVIGPGDLRLSSDGAVAQRSSTRASAPFPAIHIPRDEWLEFSKVVEVCYKSPAPDGDAMQHIIQRLEHRLKPELINASKPLGWFEPVDDLFWTKFLLANHFDEHTTLAAAVRYLSFRWTERCPASNYLRFFDGKLIAPCTTRDGMAVLVLRLRYVKHMSLEWAKAWFSASLDAVIAWNIMQRMNGATSQNKLERFVLLVDLRGAGKANLQFKLGKELSLLASSRYPDFMNTAIVVNANFILMSFWSALKPLLDARMQSKYDFARPGDSSLTDLICERDLPRSFGGTAAEWPSPEAMTLEDRLGIFRNVFFEPTMPARSDSEGKLGSSMGRGDNSCGCCWSCCPFPTGKLDIKALR